MPSAGDGGQRTWWPASAPRGARESQHGRAIDVGDLMVHRGGGELAERRPAIADLRPAVRELQIVELAVQQAVERLLETLLDRGGSSRAVRR
jgi:hypothetical protein